MADGRMYQDVGKNHDIAYEPQSDLNSDGHVGHGNWRRACIRMVNVVSILVC